MQSAAPEGGSGSQPIPPICAYSPQYVKELSFRNAAAAAAQAYDIQPTIDMGVEVKSRSVGDRSDAFEVDLCINVNAQAPRRH